MSKDYLLFVIKSYYRDSQNTKQFHLNVLLLVTNYFEICLTQKTKLTINTKYNKIIWKYKTCKKNMYDIMKTHSLNRHYSFLKLKIITDWFISQGIVPFLIWQECGREPTPRKKEIKSDFQYTISPEWRCRDQSQTGHGPPT